MRYDFDNIGMFGGYDPRRKFWVASAVGAAIGLGSTIFGGVQSSKKEREAQAKENASHASKMAYFNRKMNESYTDTAAGQNMIRQAKDYADRNWKKSQGSAAVGGGTDAATAMAKESGNRMVGETVANMAAHDTARKDRAGDQMMNEESSYASQQASHLRQQGQNIANVASAAGNAISQGLSGLEGGKSSSETSTGIDNKSTLSDSQKTMINVDWESDPEGWKRTKKDILG